MVKLHGVMTGLDRCLPLALLLVMAVAFVQVRPLATKFRLASQQRTSPEEENRPNEEQRQSEYENKLVSHRARHGVSVEKSISSQVRDGCNTRQCVRASMASAEYEFRNGIGGPLRC